MEKEYQVPVEWICVAYVPVKANSMQEAIDKTSKADARNHQVSSDGFEIREDLIQELNPDVSDKEFDSLVTDGSAMVTDSEGEDDKE